MEKLIQEQSEEKLRKSQLDESSSRHEKSVIDDQKSQVDSQKSRSRLDDFISQRSRSRIEEGEDKVITDRFLETEKSGRDLLSRSQQKSHSNLSSSSDDGMNKSKRIFVTNKSKVPALESWKKIPKIMKLCSDLEFY